MKNFNLCQGHPKRLIVEGHDDRHSVIGLMQHHINWPGDKEHWPVCIEVGNGAEEILRKPYITAKLKEARVEVIGFLLDADFGAGADSRYRSLRSSCAPFFRDLPETFPEGGLVAGNGDGKRLGLWVMPDNRLQGGLELFLRQLVPERSRRVWQHAIESVAIARQYGAPWTDPHIDKANLYTWLAWQEPPSQQPGLALTQKILDPKSPYAGPFIDWFRRLYGL